MRVQICQRAFLFGLFREQDPTSRLRTGTTLFANLEIEHNEIATYGPPIGRAVLRGQQVAGDAGPAIEVAEAGGASAPHAQAPCGYAGPRAAEAFMPCAQRRAVPASDLSGPAMPTDPARGSRAGGPVRIRSMARAVARPPSWRSGLAVSAEGALEQIVEASHV